MSSLQAFYAGAFTNAGLSSPLSAVLLDGNTASTDILMNSNDISGASTISTVSLVASGLVSGANLASSGPVSGTSITSTGAVSGSSISTTGIITCGNNLNVLNGYINQSFAPTLCSYQVLNYNLLTNSIGAVISQDLNFSPTVPMSITTGTWNVFYTSPTVLPKGVYILTARVIFQNSNPATQECTVYFASGDTTDNFPYSNAGVGGINQNFGTVSFTSRFLSTTNGLTSPKFFYYCDAPSAGAYISQLSWQCIRIG